MKKLKLQALGLGASEVLTRTQLKNILGGNGSGSCTVPITKCSTDAECSGTCNKCCRVNDTLKGCASSCG